MLGEGGGISVAIETATSHIKVEPAAGGGRLLPRVDVKAMESVTAIFKAGEAYLVANPDAYN